MEELLGTPGYFNVTKDEAKLLIHPHLATDGYYLLRPTDDTRAICTICVSNRQKLMNYKLMQESQTRQYYIREQKFSSISELVRHYNRYPINPAHNTRLLYPVQAEQTDEYVALEPARDPPPVNNPVNNPPPITNNPPPVHNRRQASLPQSPPALPDRPRPSSSSNYSNRSLPPVPTEPSTSTADARKRNSIQPKVNRKDSCSEVVENLPGVHVDLQKHHVPIILDHFAGRDSSYLVRPSASSKGQFTISLVCESSILNFKINQDPNDAKYFVTPKKKFSTIKELLETHKTAPLKSKARSGAKIFLLHPITASEVRLVLDMIKQKQQQQQQQQSISTQVVEQLPPPWKEYFDKNHQRPYFYNTQTKETVWERPSGGKKLSKANTMDQRGSPRHTPTHGANTLAVRHSIDSQRSLKPSQSPRADVHAEHRGSLPDLPPKSPTPKRHGDDPYSDRKLPQLPPKDITPSSSFDRLDQPLPLPQTGRSMPPLPPKDISTLPPLPEKVPSLPNKETPSPHPTNIPALPPKNPNDYNPPVNASLPPLPPKDPSSLTNNNPAISLPPLPPKVPSPTVKNFSDRPTEYEETVIIPSSKSQRSSVTAPLPPPIMLSDNGPPPPPPIASGLPVPPPAPPIPPQGIPGVPPPPPPISPALSSQRKLPSESSSSSPKSNGNGGSSSSSSGGGRPFSANDLLQQKNRLKAKKEEEEEPRHRTGTFLENTLSNAIELRLVNIRNAMDSGEDTDVEEVDDDDDWD